MNNDSEILHEFSEGLAIRIKAKLDICTSNLMYEFQMVP